MRTKLLIHITAICLLLVCASSCAFWRVDLNHVLLRSDRITSLEEEQKILRKAKLEWSDDGRVRVIYVQGTPYERGYQQGALLREEIQRNIGYMYKQALKTYRSKELFAEAFERLRPFISEAHLEEMHGLAHGAKVSLEMIHHIHALPSLAEWGGKKRLKGIVKQMLAGELGTTCSNFCAFDSATANQELLSVRILDWGLYRISKLHEYPLITVGRGPGELDYANIGWVGFIGAVSGMNAAGITLGEMGYRDPEYETLRGKPMVFLLREILSHAPSISAVRELIKDSPGENSYAFLMSAPNGEAELYVKDPRRFLVFRPGEPIVDNEDNLEGLNDLVYAGHFGETMESLLKQYQGQITSELIMQELIPKMAMKSNFQNVIYAPRRLSFWVSNARDKQHRAAEEPYTFFDFGAARERFPAP